MPNPVSFKGNCAICEMRGIFAISYSYDSALNHLFYSHKTIFEQIHGLQATLERRVRFLEALEFLSGRTDGESSTQALTVSAVSHSGIIGPISIVGMGAGQTLKEHVREGRVELVRELLSSGVEISENDLVWAIGRAEADGNEEMLDALYMS